MPHDRWPEYVCHKIVRAARILSVSPEDVITVQLPNGFLDVFDPTEPSSRKNAVPGAWAVVYHDGYKSISPEKAFTDGYTRRIV